MRRTKRPRGLAHSEQTAFMQSLPVLQSRNHREGNVCSHKLRRGPRAAVVASQSLPRGQKWEDAAAKPRMGGLPTPHSRMRLHPFAVSSDIGEDISTDDAEGREEAKGSPPEMPTKRAMSVETRRKISFAMLGQPKSAEMRAKVSEKLKGRVPWNKGKKLSPETRARMSEARVGRGAWNSGRRLSDAHRHAISRASLAVARKASPETRRRMRMARRRPGDAILSGSSGVALPDVGSYPLVDSADINDFVTLRRELRVWSDSFVERNSRRPSLADIRRVASEPVMRKFEKYVQMRDRIRGLASDVYGSVNPRDVPVTLIGDVASAPRNNNAKTVIRVTKHGNPRLVDANGRVPGNGKYRVDSGPLEGDAEDMWDMYDRPASLIEESSSSEADNTLIGAHELIPKRRDQLSANDYRMIGKYRLMESSDINRYVALRKELERWSASFKNTHGRTPKLSDVRSSGKSMWYDRFCEYLGMRGRISGLVREVYQTELDDVETLRKVNVEGKEILDTLRSGSSVGTGPDRVWSPPNHSNFADSVR